MEFKEVEDLFVDNIYLYDKYLSVVNGALLY